MFGRKKTDNPIYYPLLASESLSGQGMSSEEDHEVWSRFLSLDEEKKNILTSDEIHEKIKELQEKLECDDVAIEGISVLIRWFFFGQIDQQGFEEGLTDTVGEKASETVEFIQKEILTIKPKAKAEEVPEEEKKRVAALVRLPLLQALSKYEQLGNQLITKERIRIKSQGEPVRPSLLYWIKYYRDELGVGHHDSVQRGNFLFRSENGKRLSPEERERVNLVLKSVEENFPLEIDTEQMTIVFPAFVPPRPTERPLMPERAAPLPGNQTFSFGTQAAKSVAAPERAGTVSFSSKHVLPAEKEQAVVQAEEAHPKVSEPPKMAPRPVAGGNPFHIRPVSLREENER